jgi:quercetin dioxygenase-like cupin family protein
MIQPGQTLYNPVTKERMTFLRTSRQTGGDHVLVELRAAPGGTVAAAHTHPLQTETFHVLSGALGARIGRKEVVAHAGDELTVEPRTPHKWWNAGADELVFRCVVRPAGQFEELIETCSRSPPTARRTPRGCRTRSGSP